MWSFASSWGWILAGAEVVVGPGGEAAQGGGRPARTGGGLTGEALVHTAEGPIAGRHQENEGGTAGGTRVGNIGAVGVPGVPALGSIRGMKARKEEPKLHVGMQSATKVIGRCNKQYNSWTCPPIMLVLLSHLFQASGMCYPLCINHRCPRATMLARMVRVATEMILELGVLSERPRALIQRDSLSDERTRLIRDFFG